MVQTRATIKQKRAEAARQKKREEAEAARQKKRDEAYEAAISRQVEDGHEIQDEHAEEELPMIRRKKHVGTQTMLGGPVVQAMDRTFTVSIKILFGLIAFLGFRGIYYFYCYFDSSVVSCGGY